MFWFLPLPLNALVVFYLSLATSVGAAGDQTTLVDGTSKRKGYLNDELMPVSCLNRTM